MFKVAILCLFASSSAWAQVEPQVHFRQNIKTRLEKIRLAQEKSQEVIDSILSLAQRNEEINPLLSQFYYETAQEMEKRSDSANIDTHRFLVSEFSPYLTTLKQKDLAKNDVWKKKVEELDSKYREGAMSYKAWFESAGELPIRFDDESCNQQEREKLKKQLSLGFSLNQLSLTENGPLIQSWLSKGELKVSCLSDKTEYSDRDHQLSVRPNEATKKLREILSRHL